jgi:hypothetical protein
MIINRTINYLLIIFFSTVIFGCETNYIDYHSKLEVDTGNFNYALYLDGVGIGDPGYTVVRLEKSISPEDVYIKWTPSEGINYDVNHEKIEWFRERIILENYDEAGLFTSDPKIEIINNRHLVFSRGGYYFGLYDLKISKDTFNIGSPWNEWLDKSGYKSEKYDKDKEEKAYGQWIKENLDTKIRDYIETNR